jgi:putative peptidoglycan lipid II flippase
MYSLGLWAYFANHILLRAFFAQKDARTPLRISCMLSGVNILLVATLVFTALGPGAIGLATALTASINTLLLTSVLRRRWRRIGGRELAVSVGRTLTASGAMAGAIWAVKDLLLPATDWAGATTIGAGVTVAASASAGIAAFFLACLLLRSPEVRELLGRAK